MLFQQYVEYSSAFYFRLQIYISGCSFLCNQLMNLLGIYGNLGLCDLPAWKQTWIHTCGGDRCLFKALTLRTQVRWPTTRSSSLAYCIKLLPVLASTRVENYSLAAALAATSGILAILILWPWHTDVPEASNEKNYICCTGFSVYKHHSLRTASI